MVEPFCEESQAFLSNIADDPDNDLPRLIYADWLDEQGSAQGEFIRVQCERAKLKQWNAPQRYFRLKQREAELFEQHGDDFAGPCRSVKPEFRRGLVESVCIDDLESLEILGANANVNAVRAYGDMPPCSSEFDWTQIREIQLHSQIRANILQFSKLLETDQLHSIVNLDLSVLARPAIDIEQLPQLESVCLPLHPNVEQLIPILRKSFRRVQLGFRFSKNVPASVIASIRPERLESLSLNLIDARSDEICRSLESILKGSANLRELTIACYYASSRVIAMLDSCDLANLQHLQILGRASFRAINELFRSRNFPNLRSIECQGSEAWDGYSITELAKTPVAQQLNRLLIDSGRIQETKSLMKFLIVAGWKPESCRILRWGNFQSDYSLIDPYLFGCDISDLYSVNGTNGELPATTR